MYEIVALLLFVSQLPNLSIIYAVEIQLVKQKLQQYTRNVVKKTKDIYRSWYEYFYPVEKIVKKEIRTIPYEDKYKEKFRLLENNNATSDLKNNILIEETPIGNVIMFYNPENFRFEFYADKSIPFRYLETVARRYVIMFNCKSVFIEPTHGKHKKTNGFLYLGKTANYSFLKKVEKHITNKKINVSFKEFKNMKL
jgi:hypothetical protein